MSVVRRFSLGSGLVLSASLIATVCLTGAAAQRPSIVPTPTTIPQRAQHVHRPVRVQIQAGWFSRGLHELEIPSLTALCRRFRPNHVRGGCAAELYQIELPRRRIFLGSYALDRTEVTRRAYDGCVDAGRCAPPRTHADDPRVGRPTMPVTGVNWHDAAAYCAWVGGRLPTESEWERAARGPMGRRFPWGRMFNEHFANHGQGNRQPNAIDGFSFLAPVGSFPAGESASGALDMAGNVWEWTADAFSDNEAWIGELPIDPQGDPSGGARIIRGGGWLSPPHELRTTVRIPVPAGQVSPELGFRCAFSIR